MTFFDIKKNEHEISIIAAAPEATDRCRRPEANMQDSFNKPTAFRLRLTFLFRLQ